MGLTLVTAPASEPVTLEDAKRQCRIDASISDDDAWLEAAIVAARQHVENETHRALITQAWTLTLDGFPCGEITLPIGPVSAVDRIVYLDTDGQQQTWAADQYRTVLPSGPQAGKARIEPAYGLSYPSTRDVIGAVSVEFTAGYGAAGDVPAPLTAVMKMLIAHWYQHREAVVTGATSAPLALAVESLLWPYRLF